MLMVLLKTMERKKERRTTSKLITLNLSSSSQALAPTTSRKWLKTIKKT
jgi:hypothetical protein